MRSPDVAERQHTEHPMLAAPLLRTCDVLRVVGVCQDDARAQAWVHGGPVGARHDGVRVRVVVAGQHVVLGVVLRVVVVSQ